MATVTTATGSMAAEIREHYDKVMLYIAKPDLIHIRHARKRPIPRGEGKVINWRRASLLSAASTPLTEGVTPSSNTMTVTNVSATVQQYGDWIEFSDRVSVQSIDPVLQVNAEILGQQAGNTIDQVARDVYVAGTNVRYANGRVSRVTVAAGDVLNETEIKKATRQLRAANAKTIGGYFQAIVHSYTTYDLQGTTAFLNPGYYQNRRSIETGEIFPLFGVMFNESSNAKVFTAAGASSIDVYATLIYGAEALGSSDIEGLGMETIFKELGSAGSADPLNQRQTQGWKTTFVAKILNDAFLIRVEHAVSS